MNATAKGARPKIAEKPQEREPAKNDKAESVAAAQEALRNAPLPNPGTLLGFDQSRAKMSERSKRAAKELGSKKAPKKVEYKSPYFFEEDMFSPDGGDEYTLFESVIKHKISLS